MSAFRPSRGANGRGTLALSPSPVSLHRARLIPARRRLHSRERVSIAWSDSVGAPRGRAALVRPRSRVFPRFRRAAMAPCFTRRAGRVRCGRPARKREPELPAGSTLSVRVAVTSRVGYGRIVWVVPSLAGSLLDQLCLLARRQAIVLMPVLPLLGRPCLAFHPYLLLLLLTRRETERSRNACVRPCRRERARDRLSRSRDGVATTVVRLRPERWRGRVAAGRSRPYGGCRRAVASREEPSFVTGRQEDVRVNETAGVSRLSRSFRPTPLVLRCGPRRDRPRTDRTPTSRPCPR